ncbi:MAG: pyridoxal 5'-phosphate synthase glutaminase subunit PdxT [Methanomicrobiaceae archaeon]|nr:pyridoxal 5'-phosphate synthase glutaminase subunit PdxT [Methanomicrobiaceae archaeon]
MGVRIGVLALQGDVSEHILAFRHALDGAGGVTAVRHAGDIADLDGLAIPGGESTTICRLVDKNAMRRPIETFEGGIFATCAGMVLVAVAVDDPRITPLGHIDMTVERNAFGRQRESFEADVPITGLDAPFHAVFIRAPAVTRVGPGTTVLGSVDRGIVAVRSGPHMALAFHPELGGDTRLHCMFLEHLQDTG